MWGQRYHPAFERTLVFLEYSKKEFETEQRIKELEQKRKLQRARTTALVLATATIISILFLIYAFVQKLEADDARQQAEVNLSRSQRQRKLAKEAQAFAELQRAAANAERLKAEAAQEAEEQRKIADKNAEEARISAAEALCQEGIAKINQKKAEENATRADKEAIAARKAEADAKRKRYIAQAKAMALKSLELGSEVELEGLLAQQAFAFNTTYGGEEYDNDIYNGLFFALRKDNHPLTQSLAGYDWGAARTLVTHRGDDHIYSGGSDGKIIRWKNNNGTCSPEELMNKGQAPQLSGLYT